MGFSIDGLIKKVPSGLKNVFGGAVGSKKFLVTAGASIATAFLFPKWAIVSIHVWLVCQTATDITRILTGEASALPESLAERFQEGIGNVLGGLLGSKKALVTGGVSSVIATSHPIWALSLVINWIICQTAVDIVLIIKKKKA